MRNVARHKSKSERTAPGEWTGPRYFKVYNLSPKAQRLIRDRIQRYWSTPQILRELHKRTRERIALRSLQAFCAHHRNELKAREEASDQMRVITETALKMGHKLTAGVQAQLLILLFQAARAKRLGPYHAGKLAVDLAHSEVKKGELNLRQEVERRKVKVLEEDSTARRQKSKPARSVRRPHDPSVSPAQAIRNIFGIPNEPEKK